MPGIEDDPGFFFFPDTTTPYNIAEQRNFNTFGTKVDFTWRATHALELKTGVQASMTTGREDFVSTDGEGNTGPGSNSGLKGHDIGIYAQDAYTPFEWLELRTGVRYDSHVAPFAGDEHQVSPRVKLSFFPDLSNTFYLYYGRQFIPTNIEDLRSITTISEGGDTISTSPTLPERDDFYEVGYVHRFPAGVVWKLDGYVKNSSPGIDDNTIAGTAIVTSVNLARVRIRGIESVVEVRPGGPISGYLNFAINHAYGRGPVTGGFFPTDIADVPGGWFDLDHDQRIRQSYPWSIPEAGSLRAQPASMAPASRTVQTSPLRSARGCSTSIAISTSIRASFSTAPSVTVSSWAVPSCGRNSSSTISSTSAIC